MCSSALGDPHRALLADGDEAVRRSIRNSFSWPRCTGTWNGSCSSRALITPMISGYTIGCVRVMRVRCANISCGARLPGPVRSFFRNHDEPRAAATFSPDNHQAAAVVTFLSPGLRFFHQGQFEGRKKRISAHLVRAPESWSNERVKQLDDGLLCCATTSCWSSAILLLECVPAWDGNWTWDCFLVFAWQGAGEERLIVAVNYAPATSASVTAVCRSRRQ